LRRSETALIVLERTIEHWYYIDIEKALHPVLSEKKLFFGTCEKD